MGPIGSPETSVRNYLDFILAIVTQVKVKVMQSLYRPGVAHRVPGS